MCILSTTCTRYNELRAPPHAIAPIRPFPLATPLEVHMFASLPLRSSLAWFALATVPGLAACDTPLDPAPPASSPPAATSPDAPATPAPAPAPTPTTPATFTGPLFTTFAPERAAERQSIRIPLAFDPLAAGLSAWDFTATFASNWDDRFEGQVAVVAGGLDVQVPLGAVDGEVCVFWGEHHTCAGHLTVLQGPIITAIDATPIKGGYELTLHGEVFLADAEVYPSDFGFGDALATEHHNDALLTAFLPDDHVVDGHATISVHVPSIGRCGRRSEPFDLLLAR
jgi:hypothetical protein